MSKVHILNYPKLFTFVVTSVLVNFYLTYVVSFSKKYGEVRGWVS